MSAGKLGDLLVSQSVISEEQLQAAVDYKNKNKTRLGTALINLGHVNENVLATFLSQQYGITAITLDEANISQDLTKLIPRTLCDKHCLVPIGMEGARLSVAISDPTNVSAVDDVRFLSNLDVNVYIATESSIKKTINILYGGGGGSSSPTSNEDLSRIFDPLKEEEETSNTQIQFGAEKTNFEVESESIGEKPIITLINKLFVESIKRKASDIHIEPYDGESRVRFRIDGTLHEVMKLPNSVRVAVPARIKVMASLDISEKRLPQDGRIQIRMKQSKIDVRVSTLPTIFGEKVVMRILDQGSSTPSLSKMGLEDEQLRIFRKASQQPYGMVLVTGPTGSGKSTTLYAILNELNTPDVNISTVEDPVEYNMAGINQVQMKEAIGLNFAGALRSLLRQDPDIIMIGEIRDQETGEIAIKASLTGHMVFSTLHTNDAPSTISRLLHMGVEPFLITASLTLVEAQRLIRIICPRCTGPDTTVSKEAILAAEMPENWLESFQPMKGRGCDACGNTGYKGRRGIYEVMPMTEKMRDLIVKGANADMLKQAAVDDGMITLRRAAILKFYRGETTLEEVLNNSRPDGDLQ
jgi:type IV pilus assembly protein PilB